MRWLHLSDIHVGNPGSTAQRAALTSMVAAIHAAIGGQSVDCIFITGDIAYAGLALQYDEFANTVLAGLRTLPECENARVFVSPGNHDVDCDKSVPISWERLGTRQEQFFEETPRGQLLRSSRSVAFTAYSDFLRTHRLEGPDPLTNISAVYALSNSDERFHLVVTNTALLRDREFKDREQIPLPDVSLRSVLATVPHNERVLILGHHPIYWLIQHHKNLFQSLLATHKALYIHGHAHEIETSFGPEGLISLGFGAAYQASQNAPPTPYYRNTFAVCCLSQDLLHVAPFHWDSENGRWVPTTTLPMGFQERSKLLTEGWQIAVAHGASSPVLGAPLAAATRSRMLRIVPIGHLSSADWASFITRTGLVPSDIGESQLVPKSAPLGEAFFEYKVPAGLHYIQCVGGPGTHLHRAQVEDINTRLDTEGYQSYTLITFGTLSSEAETTYQRLRTRKAISIYAASDITTRLGTIPGFEATLRNIQTAIADSEFIIAPGGRPLLLVQDKVKARWFYVADQTGAKLPELHSEVRTLRNARSDLSAATYQSDAATEGGEGRPAFDVDAYRKACQLEFRTIRYAPLATVGLRLANVTLEDLYIQTGAQVADEASRASLGRAVEDFLQGAKVDGVIKEHLSKLLGEQYGYSSSSGMDERSGWALYKHHGSIAILGDPGSGKTCFVKRELLSYCDPQPDSWYSKHTPIFVSLAEAAVGLENGSEDLLGVAADLAKRQALPITEAHLRELYSKGLLAIFLDGLDEVVSVERRSRVLAAANALIDEGRAVGNRFVLTSRPAAVHQTELPKTLQVLRIHGLTDTEMRELAERIVAARISETKGTLRLDIAQLTPAEQDTLEKFLLHCRNTPGIDRLARNPLFLTLLVMIYINSGSASAKRHRVYSQAVSTLVSLRAREAGQRILSETDLRKRLGIIALSVFRDPQGAFPTYDRVVTQIKHIVDDERGQDTPREEIEQYVQDVAEATGILVLNRVDDESKPTTVTFMHHSFLEYYAAVGLAATNYADEIPTMARLPRWRDIISLLAGIVADSADATPIVTALLSVRDAFENIVFDCALLAMDCALEGDAPPERVLLSILAGGNESLISGTLDNDSWLREQIGQRLGRLLEGSNSPLINRFLKEGLENGDEDLRAAFIDLTSHVATEASLAEEVLAAFEAAEGVESNTVRIAVCRAAARSAQLRSAAALSCIEDCLKGTPEMRMAALEAIVTAPSLGTGVADLLGGSLDDSSTDIAEQSARALMKVGILDASDSTSGIWLAKSLRRIAEGAGLATAQEISLSYSRTAIEPLLGSESKERKLLGIRLLPWVHDSHQFVHDQLMSLLKNGEREERVAALASIRIAAGARMLLTVPDAYIVRSLITGDHTRDVKFNAARTLAALGIDDPDIVRELIRYIASIRDSRQYAEAITVLAWSNSDSDIAQGFLLEEAERLLIANSGDPDWVRDVSAVLTAIAGLDLIGSGRLVSLLERNSTNYRLEISVRRRCLHALVAVAPLPRAIRVLTGLLQAAPARLGYAVITATSRFLERCRRRLSYISTVDPELDFLQQRVLVYYERAIVHAESDAPQLVAATRSALTDIRHMHSAYREFSGRELVVQPSLFPKQRTAE